MKEVILPFIKENTVSWKSGHSIFSVTFAERIIAEDYFRYLQLISKTEQAFREFSWIADQPDDFSA